MKLATAFLREPFSRMGHLYSLMFLTTRLQSILANPLRLWAILWTGVMILYLPAWKGGFQQDFHGWLLMYTDLPFWDVINRKGAGIRSFYQLTQLQLYFWTWLFGTRQLLWFLLFTALHAFNGYLLLRLCQRIFSDFRLPSAASIAVAGALLFLVNPGMTEVVIWKACYHYLIALQIVLWILIWLQRYLHDERKRWILLACGLFLLSTLTLEIWFTIPWLVLILGAGYRRAGLISGAKFSRVVWRFFVPMLGIFTAYLLLYHQRYGIWLAHGAYESSGDASVARLAGRLWSFEGHLLLGARFWPGAARQALYRIVAEGNAGWIAALLLLAGFAIYAFARYPKAGPRLRLSAMLGAFALLMIMVVLHYGPDELFYVSNDRYLYATAPFQAMLIAVIVGGLLPARRNLWMGATALMLALCIGLTSFLVFTWRTATKIFWGIQYNYHWDRAPLVLLLNIPCNHNGVGIIHANPNEEFGEHLRIFYRRPPVGKIVDVAAYNMEHSYDGVHISVQDSMNLTVTLNQWGTWWWYAGRGLLEYENEYYSLRFDKDGLSYRLRLKQRPPGMVILYSQGMHWREVDMEKRVEQW